MWSAKLPKVYQGSKFAYFADEYYLNRMDIDLFNKLQPLLKHSENGKVSLK